MKKHHVFGVPNSERISPDGKKARGPRGAAEKIHDSLRQKHLVACLAQFTCNTHLFLRAMKSMQGKGMIWDRVKTVQNPSNTWSWCNDPSNGYGLKLTKPYDILRQSKMAGWKKQQIVWWFPSSRPPFGSVWLAKGRRWNLTSAPGLWSACFLWGHFWAVRSVKPSVVHRPKQWDSLNVG